MKLDINWDLLGIGTSLACAIHCAVLPLVLTSLPILGYELVDNHAFEYVMVVLSGIIGCISLWHGYKKHHRNLRPTGIFVAGIMLLWARQVWHDYHLWILPLAVILIVTAHWMNFRACRLHQHGAEDDCDH